MAEAAFGETYKAADRAAEPAMPPPGVIPAEHIRLVRESYSHIRPASDLVAELFFRRLTAIAPDLKFMLARDMDEQRRQLLNALSLAVASLGRFDRIAPALKLLGAKYRGMGIAEIHYGAVGEALLWTLKESLGPHWSSDVEDAWSAAFTAIAETMTARG